MLIRLEIRISMRSDYSASVRRYSRTSQSRSSPSPTSSKLVYTNLDDLPDDVLVEILSRLPSYESVFKRKLVCKLWGKLMSEPYFIGRFVLQQQRKCAKTQRLLPPLNLMNQKGEAPAALLPDSHFMCGVCNDLVLCCQSLRYAQFFKICNPYTGQRVDLPNPYMVSQYVPPQYVPPVGFICDPYYKKARHDAHREVICIDVNYRCKVVILRPCEGTKKDELSSKLRACIFSFDTGEWRESIVSFPRKFSFKRIDTCSYFVHNGMLYWSSTWESSSNFLIGLDPFVISDTHSITTSTNTSCVDTCEDQESYDRCRFIELGVEEDGDNSFPLYNADHKYKIRSLGVAEGSDCLKTCVLDSSNNTHYVLFWDLKQELITRADGVGKLCLKRYISVDIAKEVQPEFYPTNLEFYPSNEGVMYARLNHRVDGVVSFTKINFDSRSSGIEVDMAGKENMLISHDRGYLSSFVICVKSFWPTPVPRLPMRKGKTPAEASRSIMKIAQGSGEVPKPSQVQHSNGVHPSGSSNSNLDDISNGVLRSSNIELGTISHVMELEKQKETEESLRHMIRQQFSLIEEKKEAEESFRRQQAVLDSEIARLRDELPREKKVKGQRWIWALISTAVTLGAALAYSYYLPGRGSPTYSFEACECDNASK
ncbi:hypothetical protein ACLB2K_070955 [Fragaria x ananassa]